jgi:hypothetical protein
LLVPGIAQIPNSTIKYTKAGMIGASSRKNGKGI